MVFDKMKKFLMIGLLSVSLLCLNGCAATYMDIPPGTIGKIWTPTGYEKEIREAGQVDIGTTAQDGKKNSLVLCDITAQTVKEAFSLAEGADNRIITRDGVPLTVDVRIQVIVPTDTKLRESIFAQVQGEPTSDTRVTRITSEQIYSKFAQGPIRNRVRTIFMKYPSYDSIISNYEDISKQISKVIAESFTNTKVPLQLLSGELSNVKADSVIVEAQNKNAAAMAQVEQIQKIGDAMKNNPSYLEKYKWDVLREVAGKGTTIIVNTDSKSNLTIPVGAK